MEEQEPPWSCLKWSGDHLEVLDQTALPQRLEIRPLRKVAEVIEAIRTLMIRGAPAIGICGAFGVVLGLDERAPGTVQAARAELDRLVEEIGASRPTAVNLTWALQRTARAAGMGGSPEEIRWLALEEALRIQAEDVDACRRIGEFGRKELASMRRILTHCNAGRLATTGMGTALGPLYAKALAGEPVEVLVTETRPLLQGARLTAWELAEAGIPVTLLADSATGAALASGLVEAVVVGCDRVARNGDTANKIGTYTLAVLARASAIPFYVAGPMSSFDPEIEDGEAIVIEQRPDEELRRLGSFCIAPPVAVWNPAFDVTPAELITAFITDVGILRPPFEDSIRAALDEANGSRLQGEGRR